MSSSPSDVLDQPQEPTADDLDSLLQLLPACRRCRQTRKRCDTRIPACWNCTKAHVECVFLDHVSSELLPRTYIASLVAHLRSLEDRVEYDVVQDPSIPDSISRIGDFVHVRGSTRYLGSQARLAHRPWYHKHSGQGSATQETPLALVPLPSVLTAVNTEMHQYLVGMYFKVPNKAYPILDPMQPYLRAITSRDSDYGSFQSFILHMVYSIACHCLPGNDNRFQQLSDTCYKQAMVHAERITAEVTIEALQAVLLLSLRSLFDPQKGSLGQQIALAHRLETELSAREQNEQNRTMARLRRSIFCLENLVATALDRPSSFVVFDSKEMREEPDEDSDFLYHLYQIQARFRRNSATAGLLDRPYEVFVRSPIVRATFHETKFLCEQDLESALELLRVYNQNDTVLNIFSCHWTYNATQFILAQKVASAMPTKAVQEHTLQGYTLAVTILGRCAVKWPNAQALLNVIINIFNSLLTVQA